MWYADNQVGDLRTCAAGGSVTIEEMIDAGVDIFADLSFGTTLFAV